MRYLIKINDLKEKIVLLEDKLSVIANQINNLQKLKSEMIWESPSKDIFMEKYDDYINNLKNISKRLVIVLSFLKSYYSNYDEEFMRLRKKYYTLLTNEVNSNGIN